MFDPHVIMEPLQMAQARHGACDMEVQGRGAVAREIEVKGVDERAGGKETRDAAATRRICLLHVDSPGREHAAEIIEVVAVFAGRDHEPGRNARPHLSEPREIVGGDGLLEPSDVRLML